VKIKMAQEAEGGYTNSAMFMESDGVAETSLTADELCLRVDKLEVADSPIKQGAVINTEGTLKPKLVTVSATIAK